MSLPLSATVRLHCHRRAVVSLQLLRSKRQIRPADPRGPPSVVYNCTQRAHRFCQSVRPSVASSSYRATSSSVATSERGSRDEPAPALQSARPTDRGPTGRGRCDYRGRTGRRGDHDGERAARLGAEKGVNYDIMSGRATASK